MRHRLFPGFFLAGGIVLATGCSAPSPAPASAAPAFDASTAKMRLDSMNRTYDERFRTSDAAYYADRYTTDACVMAPDMPRVCGLEAIAAFYWNNGQSRTMALDIRGEEVSGTAKEITEVGDYRVLDDKGTELDKGKFIAIYRSEGGRWKVHRELWNSDGGHSAPKDSTGTGS